MKYTGHRQSNPVAKERVDYKSYESRRHQEAKKSKVNPTIETILSIEDLLMETEVNWSISYEPSTKSYSIFIANLSEEEPKPKQDFGDQERPTHSSAYGWLKKDIDKLYFKQLPFEDYLLKIAKPKPIY